VFAFGSARFFGSIPALGVSTAPIVGIGATRDGGGYWLVGADGGVFAFGSARFLGASLVPGDPAVAVVVSAMGTGYGVVHRSASIDGFGSMPSGSYCTNIPLGRRMRIDVVAAATYLAPSRVCNA
jgi:hypothetical protein